MTTHLRPANRHWPVGHITISLRKTDPISPSQYHTQKKEVLQLILPKRAACRRAASYNLTLTPQSGPDAGYRRLPCHDAGPESIKYPSILAEGTQPSCYTMYCSQLNVEPCGCCHWRHSGTGFLANDSERGPEPQMFERALGHHFRSLGIRNLDPGS